MKFHSEAKVYVMFLSKAITYVDYKVFRHTELDLRLLNYF